jgi:hypothetical protein
METPFYDTKKHEKAYHMAAEIIVEMDLDFETFVSKMFFDEVILECHVLSYKQEKEEKVNEKLMNLKYFFEYALGGY